MITGIGIDLIETSRVAEKLARGNDFRDKVFSAEEIAYCEKATGKIQCYAARFAAKEAFLKATGKGMTLGFDLHEIGVVNLEDGKPEIVLSGNLLIMATQQRWNRIHLSMTHLREMAAAVVIIEE